MLYGNVWKSFSSSENELYTLDYEMENISNASLLLIKPRNAGMNTYLLEADETSMNIDLSNEASGFYTLVLIGYGQIVDYVNIQKLKMV